ncbi:MAG: lamin tail domain-containing protein, partial [Planctomycetota bacterium]
MLRFMKISLLAIVLTISLVGSPMESLRTVRAVCPLGDLSGNCEVDLPDMLVFAGQWLDADSSRVGMVAHWKLDGNAADLIGGNHGTVHGNPVWTIGQLDGALYFDGVGDYVDCGNDSSLNLTNNFSISAWFNLNDAGQVLPLCKGNVPAWVSGGAYSILCVPTNGILAFYVRDSNNTEYGYATTAVPLNEWTHIVGTFSDGNVIVYKNGSFADDDDLGTSTINSNDGSLAIGAEGDGGMPFKGMIDDVRIYDRALNEVEVQDVAKFGIPDPNYADLDDDGSVNLFDFTLLAKNWQKQGNPLVINEFMASNSSDINDLQGDHDDWFEIYNTGSITVDIGGMYLTDDLNDPTMWRIPDDSPGDTTIGPYGYLIIWADKDMPDGPLHVDFKLDGDGDEIGLFDTDGNTLVDSIVFGDQVSDISYGRYPDAGDTWRFMGLTTPEAQNSAGYLGQVADTEFSHDRGFYVEDFNVTITCDTPDTTIRYTTNGTVPSGGSTYYVAVPIRGTTCLRAVASRPGWMPSNVDTQTYIFVSDVVAQSLDGEAPGAEWPAPGSVNGQVIDYGMDRDIVEFPSQYWDLIDDALLSIPTVSLVTDLDNLFYDSTLPGIGGIYVNADEEGRDWERPVSVELIYPPNPQGPGFPDLVEVPDGGGGTRWELPAEMRDGFQVNAGLRIRGGYSAGGWNPKHAFRLFFRGEYGPTRLRYPLFGDEGVDEFDHVDFRCSQNYSWAHGGSGGRHNTMVREVFSRDTQGAMGQPYTRSRYYHLYINGHYWGLFQTQERSEASWGETYMGGDKDDYDVITSNWTFNRQMVPTDGNDAAFDRLYSATIAGFGDDERYYRVQGLNADGTPNPDYERLLDVDNLIDFMIIEYYTGDRDGPGSRYGGIPNNTYGVYNRVNPDGFKWPHHDNEHTLGAGSAERNMVYPFTTAGAQNRYFNPHWLHEQLMFANADYRIHFADHVHRHFFNGGLMTLNECRNRVMNRLDQIDMAIIAESARWGDSSSNPARTRDGDWLPELSVLINDTSDKRHLTPRIDELLDGDEQFRHWGWYPDFDAPSFNQHGGEVSSGFDVTMSGFWSTIWYTTDGHDPRLSGGSVNTAHAVAYSGGVNLTESTHVKARGRTGSTWSALNEAIFAIGPVVDNLRITEMMYHPLDTNSPDDPNAEYIELTNIGPETINLSLVRFTEGIRFTFPSLELTSGEFVLLVKDRTVFDSRYTGVPPAVDILSPYEGRLANGGERIRLEDAIGQTILDFEYKDGWRNITDGNGFSLNIIDPTNSDPNSWGEKDSWRASDYVGGSPGKDTDILPNPGAVVINEVMAHSHGTAPDWIELYNTTGTAIDLSGWFLSDNDANLMKYRIAN